MKRRRLFAILSRLAASFAKSRDIHERVARLKKRLGTRASAGMRSSNPGSPHWHYIVTPRAARALKHELILKTHKSGYAGYYRRPK